MCHRPIPGHCRVFVGPEQLEAVIEEVSKNCERLFPSHRKHSRPIDANKGGITSALHLIKLRANPGIDLILDGPYGLGQSEGFLAFWRGLSVVVVEVKCPTLWNELAGF